jgi:hypothetical protein
VEGRKDKKIVGHEINRLKNCDKFKAGAEMLLPSYKD